MQEDRPPVPRGIQRRPKFVCRLHGEDAALGVGVFKRVGGGGDGDRWLGLVQDTGRGLVQKRFRRLGGQVVAEVEEAEFGGALHWFDPVDRDAHRQQRVLIEIFEQQRRRRDREASDTDGGRGVRPETGEIGLRRLYTFSHLHDLDRAGPGVSFNPPSLRPGIGGVVMIDIGD